ncbi:hypothetical protein KSB_84910 [Ktedonobacter robiniae]|uniref:Uncharacterized protein n=1 Tax=Ktedonobacter robiniae TaxID=2778365 RepID=A0ABQ3V4Y3_9CHLR|nr:hypothetical protein KSB_84910 [Ktedonobacter robiniae]
MILMKVAHLQAPTETGSANQYGSTIASFKKDSAACVMHYSARCTQCITLGKVFHHALITLVYTEDRYTFLIVFVRK